MWWILVWVLLVVAAVAVIGALVWRLVKQVLALGRALADSAATAAGALTAPAADVGGPAAATTSVFLDPEAPGGPDAAMATRRSLRVQRTRA